MPARAHFGRLRSLLHRPSPRSWSRLAQTLAWWQDARELRELILPYCRGLLRSWPDRLRCAKSSWMEQVLHGGAKERARQAPILSLCRRVVFTRATIPLERWRAILEMNCWGELDSVKLGAMKFGGQRGFHALLESSLLDTLSHLHLHDLALSDEMFGRLLDRLDACPGFRALELESCAISTKHLSALCEHPLSRALTGLGVQDNRLSDEAFTSLPEGASLPDLTVLMLGGRPKDPHFPRRHHHYNAVGEPALRRLSDPAMLPSLRGLELGHLGMSRTSLAHLARGLGDQLVGLDLHHNALTPDAIAPFLKTRTFGGLTHVDLSHNVVGPEVVGALAAAKRTRPMRALLLNRARLTPACLHALGGLGACRELERLELMDNGLNTELIELLDKAPFAALEHLSLGGNLLADSVTAELFGRPLLGQLRVLDLRSASLGRRAMEALRRAPKWAKLDSLRLPGRALDDAARALVEAAALHAEISYEHYASAPAADPLFAMQSVAWAQREVL